MCNDEMSPEVLDRLSLFARCGDGFEIAEYDMKMRGYGELAGIRQAGFGEVDVRDVLREPELLQAAREAAAEILGRDPDLAQAVHAGLRRMFENITPFSGGSETQN